MAILKMFQESVFTDEALRNKNLFQSSSQDLNYFNLSRKRYAKQIDLLFVTHLPDKKIMIRPINVCQTFKCRFSYDFWDTVYGKMVTWLKMAAFAVTGNQANVGIEGKLKV